MRSPRPFCVSSPDRCADRRRTSRIARRLRRANAAGAKGSARGSHSFSPAASEPSSSRSTTSSQSRSAGMPPTAPASLCSSLTPSSEIFAFGSDTRRDARRALATLSPRRVDFCGLSVADELVKARDPWLRHACDQPEGERRRRRMPATARRAVRRAPRPRRCDRSRRKSSSAERSPDVNRMPRAPMFSFRCSGDEVPGIAIVIGDR